MFNKTWLRQLLSPFCNSFPLMARLIEVNHLLVMPKFFHLCKMGAWNRWSQGTSTSDVLWGYWHLKEMPLPRESWNLSKTQSWKAQLSAVIQLGSHIAGAGPLNINCRQTWSLKQLQVLYLSVVGSQERGRHALLGGYPSPSSDWAHTQAISGHKESCRKMGLLDGLLLPSSLLPK